MPPETEPERRYLVIVRGDKGPDTAHVAKVTAETLGRMSQGRTHLAFSSADGSVIGMFAKIAKPARVIRAALDGASTASDRGFVLVLELGNEFSAIGNSSGWRWLQH
jgi:hypothetical protein